MDSAAAEAAAGVVDGEDLAAAAVVLAPVAAPSRAPRRPGASVCGAERAKRRRPDGAGDSPWGTRRRQPPADKSILVIKEPPTS